MAAKTDNAIPTHLLVRHARVRESLLKAKLDGILLTTPADLGYVTGTSWEDSIIYLDHDRLTIVTDSRYETEVAEVNPWLRQSIFRGKKTMADNVADLLIKSKSAKVGFEKAFITFGQAKAIQDKIKEHKSKGSKPKLAPLAGLMTNVRKVKDTHELDALRRAITAAQDGYAIVRRDLRVGQTEQETAGRLEYEMRRLGASGASFGTNVSSGPTSAMPHYRPKNRPIQADSALLFDWGAVVDGYHSDITRTHVVGRASAKLAEIYKVVLEAQLAAIAAIKPGVQTRAVDKVARDIITKAGYGKQFGHGLGHGIGLAIHELPRLSKIAAPEPLVPGMVVTVEPGIYLPGEAGVRIEDDVLVTEAGCEVLTSLDKSFEGCHLE